MRAFQFNTRSHLSALVVHTSWDRTSIPRTDTNLPVMNQNRSFCKKTEPELNGKGETIQHIPDVMIMMGPDAALLRQCDCDVVQRV